MTAKAAELKELVLKAQQGDKNAYREFLGQAAGLIRPKLLRILSEGAAEDALQETLMAVHRAFHTLDPANSISGWIFAIAGHKANDQLRALYRSATDPDRGEESEVTVAAPSFESLDLRRQLERLPARDREILLRLKVEEQNVADIARELGIGESNVKVIAFRALQRIRLAMTEEFEDEN